MAIGTEPPSNEQEKREFYAYEELMRKFMDRYYTAKSYIVDRSEGGQLFDLQLSSDLRDTFTVEEKFRDIRDKKGGVYPIHDMLIEVIQDNATGNWGWFHTEQPNYLHYVFCTDRPLKFVLCEWNQFKAWFNARFLPSRPRIVYTSIRGWGISLNISVPLADVLGQSWAKCIPYETGEDTD